MSILSKIFSRYKDNNAPSAVAHPPEQEETFSYLFPYLYVVKGFQLFTDLYYHDRDVSLDSESIKMLSSIYKAQDSLVADHLTDAGNTEVSDLCEYFRDDGAFLSYIEYSHIDDPENKNERPSQWSSLMIARLEQPNPQQIHIDTQFVLSGFTTPVAGRSDLHFAPQVVMSRVNEAGVDKLLVPSSDLDLIQSMAYGNQAFLQLVTGLPFDKHANQTWFEPRRFNEACQIFSSLTGRTRQNIQQDITKLLDPSNQLDRSKFGEFAPS
ncbi:MAG: hypothetical protein AUJ12_05130 [Alphaproteobacteria bacterium CG1_02_46_17]|nr:MAG: hypothetical protein AUJ12_05130 [Alphaproteobacteria bacterium CG1_02_46_17]